MLTGFLNWSHSSAFQYSSGALLAAVSGPLREVQAPVYVSGSTMTPSRCTI
jgi:hypothetical protein